MKRTSRFTSLFRLRSKEIESAFSRAHRCASRAGIRVLFAAGTQSPAKVLIVPTRKLKGHVRRNKLRRQIKAIVYENQLASQTGSFIILLYPQAAELSYDQIKTFIVSAFLRKTVS